MPLSKKDFVPATLPWHTVHGEDLLSLLRRAKAGEDPDDLYMELYLASDHEDLGKEDTDDND